MLNTQTINLHFSRSYSKVLQISSAFAGSFVLLVHQRQVKDQKAGEIICHVDRGGKTISQFQAGQVLGQFAMMSEYKLTVASRSRQVLLMVNLQEKTVREVPHQFIQHIGELQLITFSQSRLFSVVQRALFKNQQVKITFYNQAAEVTSYPVEGQKVEIQKPCKYVRKGNNYSMLLFHNQIYQGVILIQVIQLKECKESTYFQIQHKLVKIPIEPALAAAGIHGAPSIRTDFLWQIRKGFLTIISLFPSYHSGQEGNSNLQISLKENILQKGTILVPEGLKLSGEVLFLDEFIVIDTYVSGQNPQENQEIKTLYFNSQEGFLEISNLRIENSLQRLYYVGYEGSKMLRATFNNTAVDRAVIEIIQPLSLKNTYLQMLLHLNADFDDDLLLDALQLMQCV